VRETITINRIIQCSFIGKEVAQQISAYALSHNENHEATEIFTKYCSGQHSCASADCQIIVGLPGKIYTKPLDGILKCFNT